jgi:hypothetical protein
MGEIDSLVLVELTEEGEPIHPAYLFESRPHHSGWAFDAIQEDMEQLNEFCFIFIEVTANKLSDLRKKRDDLSAGIITVEAPEIGDVSDEVIQGLDHVYIPRWEDNQGFLVRAMCLLLLSAFTERSWALLCSELSPNTNARPKKRAGESKIGSFIRFLREECGVAFVEPDGSVATRERCRILRNQFAHGNWSEVRAGVDDLPLREAFFAVTHLLDSIQVGSVEPD